MERKDHALHVLDEVVRRAPSASREQLSALRSLLLSMRGAHRTETAALGIDDRWAVEFERAHRVAEIAVDEARAALRAAAADRIAALDPGRTLQIPESRAEARRLVAEAFDHEGREPAPMRVVRGGDAHGTATFRWHDAERDRILVHGPGLEDRSIHLDDVLGVSTYGGLTLVLAGEGPDAMLRLDRVAEPA